MNEGGRGVIARVSDASRHALRKQAFEGSVDSVSFAAILRAPGSLGCARHAGGEKPELSGVDWQGSSGKLVRSLGPSCFERFFNNSAGNLCGDSRRASSGAKTASNQASRFSDESRYREFGSRSSSLEALN